MIPKFEYAKDALEAGYIEKYKYLMNIDSLRKQKYLGIEWETLIIVKPFYLLVRGKHWELMDEIGKEVMFGLHSKTEKGLEESNLRQKAFEKEFMYDMIKMLNGGEYQYVVSKENKFEEVNQK